MGMRIRVLFTLMGCYFLLHIIKFCGLSGLILVDFLCWALGLGAFGCPLGNGLLVLSWHLVFYGCMRFLRLYIAGCAQDLFVLELSYLAEFNVCFLLNLVSG